MCESWVEVGVLERESESQKCVRKYAMVTNTRQKQLEINIKKEWNSNY